ncbi:MAG: hypothetical protein DRG63_03835 [Deltaproteobacteria bacterium]|nr:MAG: hypothetical protein DRG63_03835 [Deltaproteobacteria bacterium]
MVGFSKSARKGLMVAWGICTVLLLLAGCAGVSKEIVFDSPKHRVMSGFRLLELNRIEDARREFSKAVELDPSYSPAYRGLGLALGMKECFEAAFEAMEKAAVWAVTDEDKALADVGFLRLTTLQKGPQWMEEAERYFRKALEEQPNLSIHYYYMGVAYREAHRFLKASWAFKKAIVMRGELSERAEKELVMIEKILEARPDSALGKRLALKASITRAEAAALFVRELGIDKLYVRAGLVDMALPTKGLVLPEDAARHVYKEEISQVLRLGIQGLTLLPEGSFDPDRPVTRSDFATMLADILRKVEKKPGLGTQLKKRKSPFEDVSKNAPYFSDVMVCAVKEKIMGPQDGLFDPMELISGADALLAIRRLKDKLALLVLSYHARVFPRR